MILHCMKASLWEDRKYMNTWGHEEIKASGFVHCSSIEYFHRVAPIFSKEESYVLLCIDESRLTSPVLFEDDSNMGRTYPHVYGLINNDAVEMVLPFIRDEKGNYIKNQEFNHIDNK